MKNHDSEESLIPQKKILFTGDSKSKLDAQVLMAGMLGLLMGSSKGDSNTTTGEVVLNRFFEEDKLDLNPQSLKPCRICGQPNPPGELFCSAKHATLFYQNQKATVYKGKSQKSRSKRKNGK